MARNLAKAGYNVRVWNRTRSRAEPLAAHGIYVADDPADAVRGADAVLTMLFDGQQVLDVMKAATPGLRAGVVWIQSSTVGPEGLSPLVDLAREQGLHFFDAPVLGTRQPAENGELTILAAGPGAARPMAEQIFGVIGRKTIWLGDDSAAGPASRLKLVANNWVLVVSNGTAETLALAKGLGVDPQYFLEAIEGGALDLPYLRLKAGAILSGDHTPSFTVSGGLKDARLIVAGAEKTGVRLDIAPAVVERLARTEAKGHGGEDLSASYLASFDDSTS
jgi:3-hydroxyisobutyrate dehydrogenase